SPFRMYSHILSNTPHRFHSTPSFSRSFFNSDNPNSDKNSLHDTPQNPPLRFILIPFYQKMIFSTISHRRFRQNSMKAQFCILIFTFWFALNALSAEAEKFHSTADAMLIVADLLKIPVAYPEVSVMVQEERKEEGLIIEDIRWRSLDDQTPLAYIIRPA